MPVTEECESSVQKLWHVGLEYLKYFLRWKLPFQRRLSPCVVRSDGNLQPASYSSLLLSSTPPPIPTLLQVLHFSLGCKWHAGFKSVTIWAGQNPAYSANLVFHFTKTLMSLIHHHLVSPDHWVRCIFEVTPLWLCPCNLSCFAGHFSITICQGLP